MEYITFIDLLIAVPFFSKFVKMLSGQIRLFAKTLSSIHSANAKGILVVLESSCNNFLKALGTATLREFPTAGTGNKNHGMFQILEYLIK